MLSAAFVVISIICISSGFAYSIYLDIIVPIIITLVYLKCEFKYTVLSSLTSILIVSSYIGDIQAAIFMAQGIIIGIICGYLLSRKGEIYDDLFYACIASCFVMVMIDIYFSRILGVSFLKEFHEYIKAINLNDEIKEILFNIVVVSLPLGTVIISYLGGLILGKKLKILNINAKEKYKLINNFKNSGGLLCCSKKMLYISSTYIIILNVLRVNNIKLDYLYMSTLLSLIEYIMFYFTLEDSISLICRITYNFIESKAIVNFLKLLIIVTLFKFFEVTSFILIFSNIIIRIGLSIRQKQYKYVVD